MEMSTFEIVSWAIAIFKVIVFITRSYTKATHSDYSRGNYVETRNFTKTTPFDIMKETK